MASFCYLPVADSTIALRSVGRGSPVLLLHSSASSGQQWRKIAAVLGEHHRVCMPDFPGCGDSSPWHGRHARRLEDDARIIAAVAHHLGEPVDLVGHSYGGAVALAAACRHPTCIRSLTVIEPVAFSLLADGSEPACTAQITDLANAMWHGLATGDHAGAMAGFIDFWNGAGTWQQLGPDRREGFLRAIAPIAQEFCAVLSAGLTWNDLAAIDLPSSVIGGVLSPLPVRRLADRIAAVLPQAWQSVIAGAGHMAPITHPMETASLLLAHLARAGATNTEPHARAA